MNTLQHLNTGMRTSIRPFASRRVAAVRVRCAAAHTGQQPFQFLPAIILKTWQKHVESVQTSLPQKAEVTAQLGKMHWSAALVLPFASMSMSPNPNQELFVILAKLLEGYIMILTIRIVLSWFRQVNWYTEPWTYLREITDPYLNLFRGLVPSIGKIDISPIIGFVILQYAQKFLAGLAGV